MSLTPWITRAALLATTLAALALAVQLLRFLAWRRTVTAGLGDDSAVIATARGPVEFAVLGDSGGVPVLWLHGNPGGYDQLARTMLARPEMQQGMRSIVVSRPGYLRTPLTSGATPIEQAELFAALLDSLGVARVAVVGVSGGGPAALQFARLFPERTRALVLALAITKRIPPDPVGRRQKVADAFGLGDWFIWRAALAMPSRPGFEDSASVAASRRLIATIVPRARRRVGDLNDQRQFARAEPWPIDGITAPTLILGGTEDTNVPIAHAGYAKAAIPGARLELIEGDHGVTVTKEAQVTASIKAFILSTARR